MSLARRAWGYVDCAHCNVASARTIPALVHLPLPACMLPRVGIGHLAVGFASKRLAPRVSLGWLVLAPIFADLLWSVFVLLGIERARIVPGITKAMPLDLEYVGVSHSLLAMTGWGVVLAGVFFASHRDARGALVVFAGVLTHFVLDWISHRPDMPLLPSGPRVGLGLWNYPLPALATEAAMLLAGVFIYLRITRPLPGGSSRGLLSLLAFLLAMNVGAYFGPPPPSVQPMAALNLATLFVVWMVQRIDQGRELVTA